MFGGTTLLEVFARKSAAPMLRLLRNIFVPAAILCGGIYLLRLPGHAPPSYILTFSADLQNYGALPGAASWEEAYLWFIDALLHMLLFLAAALAVLRMGGWLRIGPRPFLYGIFALACATRFILPAIGHPEFLRHELYLGSVFNYSPTTHLATFALGALVATATSARTRIVTALLALAYGAATAPTFGPDRAGYIVVAAALLLAAPRMPAPRFAAPAIFATAGASLWIYLTNMIVRDGLERLHAPALLHAPGVVLAVGAGIGLWLLWRELRARTGDVTRDLWKRLSAFAKGAAPQQGARSPS
jgi:hypothetical protein